MRYMVSLSKGDETPLVRTYDNVAKAVDHINHFSYEVVHRLEKSTPILVLTDATVGAEKLSGHLIILLEEAMQREENGSWEDLFTEGRRFPLGVYTLNLSVDRKEA